MYIAFISISEVLNLFKYLYSACFKDIVFKKNLCSSKIVSNTVRMHALDVHCFHLFICISKSFPIPSECML